MKRFIAVLCTLLFTSCFAGCDNTQNQPEQTETVSQSTESAAEPVSESDIFLNYPILDAQLQSWEDSMIADLFFDSAEAAEFEERESDLIENGTSYFYNLNNHFLTIDSGNIRYCDVQKENDYWYSLLDTAWKDNDMNSLFGSDEFTDFTINDAQNMVSVYLDAMKIKYLSEPLVWSVDKDEASAYFSRFGEMTDKYGNTQENLWEDSSKCYIFLYNQEWNGISFSPKNQMYVTTLVTANEVVSFECCNIFENIAEGKNREIKISSDEAELILISSLKSESKNDDEIIIVDCGLVYALSEYNKDTKAELKPAWEITAEVNIGDLTFYMPYYINAESGQIGD